MFLWTEGLKCMANQSIPCYVLALYIDQITAIQSA